MTAVTTGERVGFRRVWALGIVLCGAAVATAVLAGRGATRVTSFETAYDDDLNDFGESLRRHAFVSNGWSWSADGLALLPGQDASVILAVEKGPDARLELALTLYSYDDLETAVECSVDGRRYLEVLRNRPSAGATIDLTGCGGGEDRIWIRLAGRHTGGSTSEPRLVLDRLTLSAPGPPQAVPFRLHRPRPTPPIELTGSVAPRVTSFEAAYDEDINDFGSSLRRHAFVSNGWSRSADGLALLPGQDASVVLAVEKDPDARLELAVWLYSYDDVETAVECSADGRRYAEVPRDPSSAGATIDLTGCGGGEDRVWIRLSGRHTGGPTSEPRLVLDKLRLSAPSPGRAVPFLLHGPRPTPPNELAGAGAPRVISFETAYDDDLNDFGASLLRHAFVSNGWIWSSDGLALLPGQDASVVLAVEKDPDARLELAVWLYSYDDLETAVECSADGRSYTEVLQDTPSVGATIDLTGCGGGGDRVWIRLSGRHSGGPTSRPHLVLDKLTLGGPVVPFLLHGPRPTPPIGLVGSVTAAMAVTVFVTVALGGHLPAAVLMALAVLSISLALALVWPGHLTGVWMMAGTEWDMILTLAGLALLVGGVVALRARGRTARPALGAAVMSWLLGVAFLGRWQLFERVMYRPLDPDAEAVALLANRMRFPYDTDFREPLWVWAAKLFQAVAEPISVSSRLLSLTLSMLLLYLAYRFVRDYSGKVGLALLTLFWLSRHGDLLASSGRGLRTELYTVTVLVLMYAAFVPGLRERLRTAGLVAGTALVSLTQLSGMALALALVGWACWRHGLGRRPILVATVVTAALVTPHLLNNARVYGDPLWSQNVHAVWYRNLEFVELAGTGCEGCPTPDAYSRNAYSGDRTTMVGYVFGMHGPGEVVERVARGYVSLYVLPSRLLAALLGTRAWVGYLLYLGGLAILFVTPMRELLLVPVLSINLLAFVIPLDIDPRLVMHAVPVVALALALPIWCAAEAVLVGPTRMRRALVSYDHAR